MHLLVSWTYLEREPVGDGSTLKEEDDISGYL